MINFLPESFKDVSDIGCSSLDYFCREGVERILACALEFEVSEYIDKHKNQRDDNNLRLVVRNGYAKTRKVVSGGGQITVTAPRIDDRRPRKKFISNILPLYTRKTCNVASVIQALYLRGLSGNSFQKALVDLLGKKAHDLSKGSIAILKKAWLKEMKEWKCRSIDDTSVYLWADGVNVRVRVGADKTVCLLVVIGVTTGGQKKLLAVKRGYRESAESWRTVFRDLIERGLNSPTVLVGDDALGLWTGIEDLPEFATTKGQRCWFHKKANVLDKLPDSVRAKAQTMLNKIAFAPSKQQAKVALHAFQDEWQGKYPKAVSCLKKDWQALTTFFAMPKKHWKYLRTTNHRHSKYAGR